MLTQDIFEYLEPVFEVIVNKANDLLTYKSKLNTVFPVLFMISDDYGNSFRWFMTSEQRDFIKSDLVKKGLSKYEAEAYFENWIQFRFSEGGMIKYLYNIQRSTEYIKDFISETRIIEQGYRIDQAGNKSLTNTYVDKLWHKIKGNSIGTDPFIALENIWADDKANYYYFEISPEGKKRYVVYALVPFYSGYIGSFISDIESKYKIKEIIDFAINAMESSLALRPKIEESYEQIRQHALKSAISAIMSRNGSHNIGSHVIYNVIKKINTLNVQDNKYLFKYLQQRMDFVAQVSTGWVADWSSPTWVIKELVKGLLEQSHLLNFIARSEGLSFSTVGKDKIRNIIKCISTDNNGQIDKVEIDFSGDSVNGSDTSKLTDFQVSIPGGIIGNHAFYTIAENIMRNAAKHGFSALPIEYKQKKNLKITMEFKDKYEVDHVEVTIWDNASYISTKSSFYDKKLPEEFSIDSDSMKNIIKLVENTTAVICVSSDGKADISLQNIDYLNAPSLSEEHIYLFVHPYDGCKCECSNCDKPEATAEQPKHHPKCEPTYIPNLDLLLSLKNVRFVNEPKWSKFVEDYSNASDAKPQTLSSFIKYCWTPANEVIKDKLNRDLISPDGTLRKESWGLGEIRICAGYLQNARIAEVGSIDCLKYLQPDVVPEYCSANAEDKHIRAYRLGYKFNLKKPKEILIICDKDTDIRVFDHALLKKEGTYVTNISNVIESTVFDYEIVIFCGNSVDDLASNLSISNNYIDRLPFRTIASKGNEELFNNIHRKRIAVLPEVEVIVDNILSHPSDIKSYKLSIYRQWLLFLSNNQDVRLKALITTEDAPNSASADDDEMILLKNALLEVYGKERVDRNYGLIVEQTKEVLMKAYGYFNNNYVPQTWPVNKFDTLAGNRDSQSENQGSTSAIVDYSLKSDSVINDLNALPSNTINILYERHNSELEQNNSIYRYLENHRYVENLRGGAACFPIIANITNLISRDAQEMNLYQEKILAYKMIENGLIRVAIADERFWGYVKDKQNICAKLEGMGIIPVDQFISFINDDNLPGKNVLSIVQENDSISVRSTETNGLDIDILIIHQGIIDKLSLSTERVESIIHQLKKLIPVVVVTSGRGEPPDMAKNVKFIGFSILENYVLSNPPSKLLLTNVLMKLTRSRII